MRSKNAAASLVGFRVGPVPARSGGSELVSVEQQDSIVRRDPVERGQPRPQTSRRRAIRAQEPERACFISRDHGGSTGAEAMGVFGSFDELDDCVSVVHEEQAPLL
jgi:hypothetical protein